MDAIGRTYFLLGSLRGFNVSSTPTLQSLHPPSSFCSLTLHSIALHFTAFHFTALHCTALHCTSLHYTALHCTSLHCTALYYTTLHYTSLHFTALHCTSFIFTSLHRQSGRVEGLVTIRYSDGGTYEGPYVHDNWLDVAGQVRAFSTAFNGIVLMCVGEEYFEIIK